MKHRVALAADHGGLELKREPAKVPGIRACICRDTRD